MFGRDEQMQSGFVNFQNFAQGFGFTSGEAIFLGKGVSKTPPGTRLQCRHGVFVRNEKRCGNFLLRKTSVAAFSQV